MLFPQPLLQSFTHYQTEAALPYKLQETNVNTPYGAAMVTFFYREKTIFCITQLSIQTTNLSRPPLGYMTSKSVLQKSYTH